MQKQLEISHHGFEASEGLDSYIADKVGQLEKLHQGIVSCRVSMEKTSHRHGQHDGWEVKVLVTVPPRHDLMAKHSVERADSAQSAVYKALDAAFSAVGKQLRRLVDKK